MDNYYLFNQSRISYFIDQKSSNDLSIIQCSFEKCTSVKATIGPTMYNHYTMHYVVSGEGFYKTNNKVHKLKQGDIFIIFPRTIITYYPDTNNPWSYCWIDFEGIKGESYLNRAGFTYDNPIFHCPDEFIYHLFLKAFETSETHKSSNDLIVSSYFYQIISHIIELTSINITYSKNEKESHILKAIKYIDTNYNVMPSITATDISNVLGLNVNYFSRLFKEIMGMPFSNYLTEIRLQKAIILFQQGIHTVKDVSNSVGFSDPLYFSKIFKKHYGKSPKDYTKSL